MPDSDASRPLPHTGRISGAEFAAAPLFGGDAGHPKKALAGAGMGNLPTCGGATYSVYDFTSQYCRSARVVSRWVSQTPTSESHVVPLAGPSDEVLVKSKGGLHEVPSGRFGCKKGGLHGVIDSDLSLLKTFEYSPKSVSLQGEFPIEEVEITQMPLCCGPNTNFGSSSSSFARRWGAGFIRMGGTAMMAGLTGPAQWQF